MKTIDELLNRVTMYWLVVYALATYAGFGILLALFDRLSFSATDMIVSLGLLLGSAWITNRIFSRLFNVPTNAETWRITALILFLILHPATNITGDLALIVAGAVSSASKFLITWNGKHIFNPAALAAASLSLTGLHATTWWIGSSIFWPLTLLVGLAIVRKIRRFPLFLTFVLIAVVLQVIVFVLHDQLDASVVRGMLIVSPLIFLSTIMLTEPATMPPRRQQQMIFAAIVAVLYITAWDIGPLHIYPEIALLIGNVYAFAVSPKLRVRMQLKEIQRISDRVYNYVWQPEKAFTFLPGQYLEWTLAGVPYNNRGNRRTFSIASSPTEKDVYIGMKYYEKPSAFKTVFQTLKPGDHIYASQLAGNFTLDDSNSKLVFIAGGIGITPFRSMVKYLLDNDIKRDITLLYVVSNPEELAYKNEFVTARKIGLKYIPIVTNDTFKLNSKLIAEQVPDYAERQFYISGPSRMVDASKKYLLDLKVPRAHIKTDHFSGY